MLAPPELSEPLGLSAVKILGSCACAGAESTKHGSTREMRIERTNWRAWRRTRLMKRTEGQAGAVIVKLLHFGNS
jgi:hypothetical protein